MLFLAEVQLHTVSPCSTSFDCLLVHRLTKPPTTCAPIRSDSAHCLTTFHTLFGESSSAIIDSIDPNAMLHTPSRPKVAMQSRTAVTVVATKPLHQELMRVKYQLNTGTLLLHKAKGCEQV